MRHQPPGGRYAAGTKIDSHRSRAELELLLARYGASDFVVLEHDANATIRFALHGRYVHYVLPLPEPEGPDFTHTPTGRPRNPAAQERAYEQAVRQQWRRAVLVMKAKLEAVESGLSPFEREFYGAIQDDDRREKPPALLLRRRLRWAPETMLLILCLGVLVPAGGAVALGVPAVAVERLAAPAYGDPADPLGASGRKASSQSHALRLGDTPPAASGSADDWQAASSDYGQDAEENGEGKKDHGEGATHGRGSGKPDGTNSKKSPKADKADKADKPDKDDKPDKPGKLDEQADESKPGKPDKEKPGKPDKDKDAAKSDASATKPSKPPKPSKSPKDKPKKDTATAQAQEPAPSDTGKDKDKSKAQGAAKEDKGAGGAAKGKK